MLNLDSLNQASYESYEEKQAEEDMVSETESPRSTVKKVNLMKRDFALDEPLGVRTRTRINPDGNEDKHFDSKILKKNNQNA